MIFRTSALKHDSMTETNIKLYEIKFEILKSVIFVLWLYRLWRHVVW